MSVARRSASKLFEILSRSADPATLAGETRFYSKQVSGSAEWFIKSGAGIVNQMTGPGAVLPTAYVSGLACSWVSTSQVQVAAGRARSSTGSVVVDQSDIILAAPITVDITVAGVNGLDAGAEAASTWYAIWVIGDSTGVNAGATLLSASFTAPTLPAGYNQARRIGCVRNSAGSDFLRFFQRWNGRTRRHWFDESRATLQVLTNGSALAFTTVTCTSRIPPTSQNAIFGIEFLSPTVGGALGDVIAVRPTGSTEASGPMQFRIGGTSTVSMMEQAEVAVSSGQQIDYLVSDADDVANLYVLGFDDEI